MRRFKNNKDIEHVLRDLLTDKPQTAHEIYLELREMGYNWTNMSRKKGRSTTGRIRSLSFTLHQMPDVQHRHTNKLWFWRG